MLALCADDSIAAVGQTRPAAETPVAGPRSGPATAGGSLSGGWLQLRERVGRVRVDGAKMRGRHSFDQAPAGQHVRDDDHLSDRQCGTG